MNAIRHLLPALILMLPCARGEAARHLVEDGQARAQIVIASEPSRSTRLAARELQLYVEKISSARLPIVTEPTAAFPVRVLVGESAHTKKLGITTAGLEDGAFRIVSGEDWIAFIGDDADFTPIEPWPRGNSDIASGKMQAAWNKITGAQWGYTHSQLHKHYSGPNSLFGTPNEQKTDKDGNVNVWTYDERGSFNAVCSFLRDLGVRWYLPGAIGEVLPELHSIPLPKVNKVVRPDFPMRNLNFRTAVYGRDVMMWGFHLGTRQPWGRQAAHGLHHMTHNEATLKAHPDWFALYGGKRHNQPGQRLNQLCYSNEELFGEAVRFARAQFDHYDMDVVSIMPPDGYTAICQCGLCAGKESPQLGERGRLSNYVWDFVNRVAKEIAKSHPGKRISNCAYGVYTEPPDNIDKLEPNLQVIVVGGRRPTQAGRADLKRLREAWAKKTDNPLEIFETYPFTGRGFYLPAYIPRTLGESINATKGLSRGEDIWLTMDFKENAVGFNHFLVYFTARMYWGGKEQDPVALFDEYVEKFYGPAALPMRAFFAFCEENWRAMEGDAAKAGHALELFAKAKAAVPPESLHGRRIQLIDNYLNGLRNKAEQLAQKRGPVPVLRLVGSDPLAPIVIDGRLDDKPWVDIPVASTGRLRELQTGGLPTFGTSFKAEWRGASLYLAVRCDELPGGKPNIATTKSGDPAIWYGDAVEVLLATESHSYYQIVVNPAGALVDLDRGAARSQWFNWSSQAEVATQVADDHWIVELRIPITKDENDPLHQVIGRKPTQSLPWHINLCRQRIRDDGSEFSAFSPTATTGFHAPMKFANFYGGRSHRFEADETVTDFIIAGRHAEKLLRGRRFADARAAYLAMAKADDATELQQSVALSQAALCARMNKEFDLADDLVGRIPVPAVAKTARMDNLLTQRDWAGIEKEFGAEDLATWPFWQRGAGAFARGRARAILKMGAKADADFQTALTFTADPRIRTSILAAMGHNRESNLGDDQGALTAYRQNFEGGKNIGAADEFRSVQNAARILSRQGRHEEALAALGQIDFGKQKGVWRHTTMLALGEVLAAAGQKDEAVAMFEKVTKDASAQAGHRKAAEAALLKLRGR